MSAVIRPAIIVSVQGTNPGPASQISYTVDVEFEYGNQRATGVTPHNARLTDAIKTVAATPGTAVLCFETAGNLQFFIIEGFDYDPSCEGA